jgi:hypothetical protein
LNFLLIDVIPRKGTENLQGGELAAADKC